MYPYAISLHATLVCELSISTVCGICELQQLCTGVTTNFFCVSNLFYVALFCIYLRTCAVSVWNVHDA